MFPLTLVTIGTPFIALLLLISFRLIFDSQLWSQHVRFGSTLNCPHSLMDWLWLKKIACGLALGMETAFIGGGPAAMFWGSVVLYTGLEKSDPCCFILAGCSSHSLHTCFRCLWRKYHPNIQPQLAPTTGASEWPRPSNVVLYPGSLGGLTSLECGPCHFQPLPFAYAPSINFPELMICPSGCYSAAYLRN